MEFSPEDIADREFLSAVGGFDREEVRQFLVAVAAQIRDKNRQIKELNEKVHTLEESASEQPTMPTLDETLLTDLQDEARKLVGDLRGSVDEVSALVSELRDAKDVVADLPQITPATTKTESLRATLDAADPPAASEQPSVGPPSEWQDLLSDPERS